MRSVNFSYNMTQPSQMTSFLSVNNLFCMIFSVSVVSREGNSSCVVPSQLFCLPRFLLWLLHFPHVVADQSISLIYHNVLFRFFPYVHVRRSIWQTTFDSSLTTNFVNFVVFPFLTYRRCYRVLI